MCQASVESRGAFGGWWICPPPEYDKNHMEENTLSFKKKYENILWEHATHFVYDEINDILYPLSVWNWVPELHILRNE